MGKYFGTDGFRGEANVDLTVEHAFKIGRYLGYYYGKEHKCKVVIGKDTRRSSYMFEYALSAGLTASGADAYLLHVTTTPSVSYVTRTEDFDLGIMISASHNPFYDNGIKLINSRGEKMSENITDDIEKYLDASCDFLPYATGDKIGRTVDYVVGRNRYTGYIISLARHSYKGIKVGIDTSNGATWMLAKNIFDTLGAKTYVINSSPDGLNINKDCGSTNMESLKKLVREEKLDIAFAFDGDADRCLAVDENGEEISGDHILYFSSLYMKRNGMLDKDTVVATIMSNMGLEKSLSAHNINVETTDVGDKYVYECMAKNRYCLGGEDSGHIIFSKFASTGDGLITAIKIMEVLIESKLPASRLKDGFIRYPQKTVSIKVSDKEKIINNNEIRKLYDICVNELGDKGRILLRKSGTEPVIRVMTEAENENLCNKYLKILSDKITELG